MGLVIGIVVVVVIVLLVIFVIAGYNGLVRARNADKADGGSRQAIGTPYHHGLRRRLSVCSRSGSRRLAA